MFDAIDKAFYERRAREARVAADACIDPGLAAIHRRFADEYDRKIGELTIHATARGRAPVSRRSARS